VQFNNFKKFFIFSIIGCVTLMPILIAPALVGVLVDHGQFSESYAGWVIALSITLLLFAGASLLISIIRMQINAK